MPLYIISTPIGHPDDISKRACETLNQVDFVICEETKEGSRLLKKLNIQKELYPLNEHNESEQTPEMIALLQKGQSGALISDCGTPLFADPGRILVQACHENDIKVVPIPGASSILAALVVSGLDLNQFYYAGFLPRSKEERQAEIKNILHFTCPVIVYDTPYRLNALIRDLYEVLPHERTITVAMELTKPDEKIVQATIKEVWKEFSKQKVKKEFVIIIAPPFTSEPSRNKKITRRDQLPQKKRRTANNKQFKKDVAIRKRAIGVGTRKTLEPI